MKHLEEKFLNKKITFETEKGLSYVGICSFIGNNKFFLSWGLQINIGRMPVTNVIEKSIKII